ncbi:hypothetical protein HBH56_082280 [Parastagonospora nodorum]|uniref:Uncharacterized protein n=1 Tax=Phaeosphaeria nodorum (strain SN15 / ATCC MYA-4574 / FGSC 10173) TaxID=321614 RepID=A0A7U2F0V0_PHANO|nr:hypothetical protein HBH56_082280 [Parastagonospora nodorum]QRC96641.1 hypothetical protein JI435_015470 [Parastagonospora nodorum SN15]KAH3929886.1 hypothetical protein HBH54_119560 [Parastagonospora nodorum]KAH3955813.1 hypothetical protein HBH53_005010 [Parastagonospora nodorum]KAH3976750.1 hypothetical protein HBH51_076510 [Parastagonospora nodorum]
MFTRSFNRLFKYDRVESQSSEDQTPYLDGPEKSHHPPLYPGIETKSASKKFSFFPKLGLIILLLATVAAIAAFTIPTKPSYKTLDCGTTTNEARKRGCIYSVVDGQWLPAPCYDKEMDDEFTSVPWKYWAHMNRSVEIQAQEVKMGESGFWVDVDWHVAHCKFVMKMVRRQFQRATGSEKDVAWNPFRTDEHHWEHCISYLNARVVLDPDLVDSLINLDFGECKVLQ